MQNFSIVQFYMVQATIVLHNRTKRDCGLLFILCTACCSLYAHFPCEIGTPTSWVDYLMA